MTLEPAIPLGGIAGWALLRRSQPRQEANFARSPDLQRDLQRFADRIGAVTTAGDLVGDRALLKVALGAFGLDEDLNKPAFIRKVLESDPLDPTSFANRLVDRRYRDLARAFGFGSVLGPRTGEAGFADRIGRAFMERQFEIAVGRKDSNLRLALAFRREMAGISRKTAGDTAWYMILGAPPLRQVVEQALGLPRQFSGLPLERQVETLKDRVRTRFGGGIEVFQDEANVERMINAFLARAGPGSASGPASPALTLLQAAGPARGSSVIEGLIGALYR